MDWHYKERNSWFLCRKFIAGKQKRHFIDECSRLIRNCSCFQSNKILLEPLKIWLRLIRLHYKYFQFSNPVRTHKVNLPRPNVHPSSNFKSIIVCESTITGVSKKGKEANMSRDEIRTNTNSSETIWVSNH